MGGVFASEEHFIKRFSKQNVETIVIRNRIISMYIIVEILMLYLLYRKTLSKLFKIMHTYSFSYMNSTLQLYLQQIVIMANGYIQLRGSFILQRVLLHCDS